MPRLIGAVVPLALCACICGLALGHGGHDHDDKHDARTHALELTASSWEAYVGPEFIWAVVRATPSRSAARFRLL